MQQQSDYQMYKKVTDFLKQARAELIKSLNSEEGGCFSTLIKQHNLTLTEYSIISERFNYPKQQALETIGKKHNLTFQETYNIYKSAYSKIAQEEVNWESSEYDYYHNGENN